MFEQLVLVAHVLIAVAIIGLILLQQGKGAEMGASFGAGSSQTLFGAQGGGNVLTRFTAILATVFFVTSFTLAVIAKNKAEALSTDGVIAIDTEFSQSAEASAAPVEAQTSAPAVDGDVPALPADGAAGDVVNDIPE